MPASPRYTQRHFRDVAALLAAERAEHGASPALNRITDAFTALFTDDSRPAGSRFDPVLFRQVALGSKATNARPVRKRIAKPSAGRVTGSPDPAEAGREYDRRFQAAVTEAARKTPGLGARGGS